MSKATNSPSGRATRLPVSSRTRGMTFHDRIDEARLRRQVVLAAKNPPGPSNSAAKPAVIRRPSGIVQPKAQAAENQEKTRIAAETSLYPPVELADDAAIREISPAVEEDETYQAPWRLVGPAVAAGFVFAMIVVVWGESQIVSLTLRTVLAVSPLSQAELPPSSESLLDATVLPAIESGFGPVIVPQGPSLDAVPGDENSTRLLRPAPVFFAALDPTPAVFSSPPKPATVATLVLVNTPSARPATIKPNTQQIPAFAGLEIVLHIPNGAAAADTEDLLTAASGAGFEIAETRPAAFKISRTNVRYFYRDDAQAARALAQAIGGRFRDFTNFTPPPDPGVIEIWLKGQGSAARTN